MICQNCGLDFEEKDVQESHDVPCYLFYNKIGRNEKKNCADKFNRRWLCKSCHERYEKWLNDFLIKTAESTSKLYFIKEGENNGYSI